MLRVAFVTPWDISNPSSWSGVIRPMFESLQQRCDVVPVSTMAVRDALVDRVATRFLNGFRGKGYLPGHALATARKRGRDLERRLQAIRPDVVLAVVASRDIAFLGGPWPVVQVSDLTFAKARELYPDFQHLLWVSRAQGETLSRLSVRRASATLAATRWAREALIHDDGVPPESVIVAPFGPGIAPPDELPVRDRADVPRVLSVISHWHRKGGDRVLAIHEELLRRGLGHQLTLVGDTPGPVPATVDAVGRVSRLQLAELLGGHQLLLEPARGNASGITLTDAANFGLVAVATRTGGVGTIVLDGQSGILFDGTDEDAIVSAGATATATAIRGWEAMGRAAKAHAEHLLTWERWSAVALGALEGAATDRLGARPQERRG